jgi:gamma-glutamyl-gamma-aminobutyrate hydrolase PuuD
MVHVGGWWALGVQWHPETDTDLRLFQALAGMAIARAEAR